MISEASEEETVDRENTPESDSESESGPESYVDENGIRHVWDSLEKRYLTREEDENNPTEKDLSKMVEEMVEKAPPPPEKETTKKKSAN